MATRMAYEYFGLQVPRSMERPQPTESLQPIERPQPTESPQPMEKNLDTQND